MSVFDIFEQISAAKGKNAKADLLRQLTHQQIEMFTWAMDPARVYYVTVDEENLPPCHGGYTENGLLGHMRDTLYSLSTRQVTGQLAYGIVNDLLTYPSNKMQQKWIARIINKDLRIGVDTAFRDVWPNAYVVFEPQLSKTYDDRDVNGWLFEDKWNGLRALAVPVGSPSSLPRRHMWFSRNGKAIPGMDHISDELARAVMPGGPNMEYVFDGEGFGGDWDDQVGQSVSKIRGNKSHEDITFNAFDMIESAEWMSIAAGNKGTTSFHTRRARLEEFFRLNPQLQKIKLVKQGKIDMAIGITPMVARDEAISRKLEGIIMKNPDGVYDPGKHTNGWYKYKKRNPADVTIIGAVEGTKRLKGRLGAILVKGNIEVFDDNGISKGFIEIVPTEIGTGFTDKQRVDFWTEFQNGGLIGDVAEIEWGEVTKDKRLFHTAFKRRRFDK